MEKDKTLHLLVCAAASATASIFVANAGSGALGACLAGFFAGSALGLGKEYGDSRCDNNHFGFKDLLADLAGAAIGCLAGLVALLI